MVAWRERFGKRCEPHFAEPPWTKESPEWKQLDCAVARGPRSPADGSGHGDVGSEAVVCLVFGGRLRRSASGSSAADGADRSVVGAAASQSMVPRRAGELCLAVGRLWHSSRVRRGTASATGRAPSSTSGFARCSSSPASVGSRRPGGVRWMVRFWPPMPRDIGCSTKHD